MGPEVCSSCVMTTVAGTLGPVKQATGWWAIYLLDQKDEATAPHISKKKSFRNTKLSDQTLWYAFPTINAFFSPIFRNIDIQHPDRFTFLPGHSVLYLTHCNILEQCWQIPDTAVLLLPLPENAIVSQFSHTRQQKESLLKNPQCLSGAAWLLLPCSGAFLRGAASFL